MGVQRQENRSGAPRGGWPTTMERIRWRPGPAHNQLRRHHGGQAAQPATGAGADQPLAHERAGGHECDAHRHGLHRSYGRVLQWYGGHGLHHGGSHEQPFQTTTLKCPASMNHLDSTHCSGIVRSRRAALGRGDERNKPGASKTVPNQKPYSGRLLRQQRVAQVDQHRPYAGKSPARSDFLTLSIRFSRPKTYGCFEEFE